MKGREVMITLVIVYNSVLLMSLLQETQVPTDFDDLGKLLLGGFAAAVVFALGFTFVRLRMREKTPQTSDFISISAPHDEKKNVDG